MSIKRISSVQDKRIFMDYILFYKYKQFITKYPPPNVNVC